MHLPEGLALDDLSSAFSPSPPPPMGLLLPIFIALWLLPWGILTPASYPNLVKLSNPILFDTGPENLEREGLVTADEFEVISIGGE
jgi:hypothetical protein